MNRIINPCSRVKINGQEFMVRTDFKVWIEVESVINDSQIPWEQRLAKILALAYLQLPPDPLGAVEGLMWFRCCGRLQRGEDGGLKPQLPLFSLKEDFPYIWAGFLGQYGVDLSKTEMHWWHFVALFEALDAGTLFGRVVACRRMNPSQIANPGLRSFYMQMKKRYRLPQSPEIRELATTLALEAGFE